jgi:hypothetical protein
MEDYQSFPGFLDCFPAFPGFSRISRAFPGFSRDPNSLDIPDILKRQVI